MKQTTLIVFALLLSVIACGQEKTVINNPYYEFKTSGIRNVSKIELSSTETRVYFENIFLPNWWSVFNEDEVLVDSDSKKEYKILDIEGAKFGERISTPRSGILNVVKIYPPLDKETKSIDIEGIFGVSLDPKLAGLQPNYSVPLEVNEWMDGEIAKCTDKPIKDFDGDNFFTNGKGRLVGYIKGYSPLSELKTGIIYLSNYLTREDYPVVVAIEEDGRFDVEIPLISPIYSRINFGRQSVDFYIEPSQTLGIIVDWQDFLLADQLRDRRYKFQKTAYKGNLAQTNFDLMRFQFEVNEYNSMSYSKRLNKLSFEEKVAELDKEKMIELNKLDFYIYSWRWTEKASKILRNEILLKHASGMFSLEQQRKYEARKDTANIKLKEPVPESYYDFLADFPWDDQSICVSQAFPSFINSFEYSSFIVRNNEGDNPYEPFTYLLENAKTLTKEEKKLIKLALKENRSDKEEETLEKSSEKFHEIYVRHSDVFAKLEAEKSVERFERESNKWVQAEEELAAKYNIEYNLPIEIATVRSLKFNFKHASKEMASSVWNKSKANIENASIIAAGDQLYDKYFGENASMAYELPEGKSTDIFNKIIEPYQGKILFVDFWGTTCGPCVGSIKSMEKVREEYKDNEDIEFVFITNERSSPQKNYDQIIKEQNMVNSHRISSDDYLYLRELFKFNGIPRYVVIGKDGKVINDNFAMHNFKTLLPEILKSDMSMK